MVTRIFMFLALCCPLLACSSESPTVTPICITSCGVDDLEEPAETTRTLSTSGGYSGGVDGAVYDPATGVFTLTATGVNAQMIRFPTADFGDMLAMRDVGGTHNAYFGQGQGVEVVVYSGGAAGNVTTLASYARTGGTELPLTGEASFTGDYVGFTSTRRINGSAMLEVDFGKSLVSGSITNRVFRQRADNVADVVNPLSVVLLEETSLASDGGFQGITGGGQIVNGQALWNPATGSFEGLIGGSTGQEAVGTVTLTHRAPSGATFEEIGGFLASQ